MSTYRALAIVIGLSGMSFAACQVGGGGGVARHDFNISERDYNGVAATDDIFAYDDLDAAGFPIANIPALSLEVRTPRSIPGTGVEGRFSFAGARSPFEFGSQTRGLSRQKAPSTALRHVSCLQRT